jgi:hypothetical protein
VVKRFLTLPPQVPIIVPKTLAQGLGHSHPGSALGSAPQQHPVGVTPSNTAKPLKASLHLILGPQESSKYNFGGPFALQQGIRA